MTAHVPDLRLLLTIYRSATELGDSGDPEEKTDTIGKGSAGKQL